MQTVFVLGYSVHHSGYRVTKYFNKFPPMETVERFVDDYLGFPTDEQIIVGDLIHFRVHRDCDQGFAFYIEEREVEHVA